MREPTNAPKPTADKDDEQTVYKLPAINKIATTTPLHWLGQGFQDLLAMPFASLFYGATLALMGYLLTTFYGGAIGIAFTTGFLLVGPFLAIGLYDLSRRRASGQPTNLGPTLTAGRENLPAIGFYAVILMLSLAVWLRVSVVVIALFFPDGVETLNELYLALKGSSDAWVFAFIYTVVGAFLAFLTFATSAIALPMLLDRKDMDAISAMIVSFDSIRQNTKAMALWGLSIIALTVAGFLSWFVGLVIVLPIIGHGTWHAYRDCVRE